MNDAITTSEICARGVEANNELLGALIKNFAKVDTEFDEKESLTDALYKGKDDGFIDSEILRHAAMEKGLSIPDLSRMTGLYKETIRRMLNGECKFYQLNQLCTLCEVLDIFPIVTIVSTKGD